MRLSAAALSLVVISVPTLAQEHAQEHLYHDTEYISGKSGLSKTKGVLVINDSGVSFRDKKGQPIFTLPINEITAARNNVETDPGSFGRKVVWGVFASKREEFLTVETQNAQGAEAIVFKCKKKTSEDMTAKIAFFRKKAEPTAPPPPE